MKTAKGVLLSLSLFSAFLFFLGCASNSSVELWKHGFSKEVTNNPIYLGDRIVSNDGHIIGLATNRKGKKFWFIANTNTKKVNIFTITDMEGIDRSDDIQILMDEVFNEGGEDLLFALEGDEANQAMEELDWTWVRNKEVISATSSYLGFGADRLEIVEGVKDLSKIPGVQVRSRKGG